MVHGPHDICRLMLKNRNAQITNFIALSIKFNKCPSSALISLEWGSTQEASMCSLPITMQGVFDAR